MGARTVPPLTVTRAIPSMPVPAQMPMPLSSASAVAGLSAAEAVTVPPVISTVAVPPPQVRARSPGTPAPETVTSPLLITVAAPASTIGSPVKLKNPAYTPDERYKSTPRPEVVIVPLFSARTVPKDFPASSMTLIAATKPSAPFPVVLILAPASLRAVTILGLSWEPPPHAIATAPIADLPSVEIVPLFTASARARVRVPSLSVWARRPNAHGPFVVTCPVPSFSTSALAVPDQATRPSEPLFPGNSPSAASVVCVRTLPLFTALAGPVLDAA